MRAEIDLASGDTLASSAALGRVALLIYQYQDAVHAKFVLNGIGKSRIAWLLRYKMIGFEPRELEWLMKEDLL